MIFNGDILFVHVPKTAGMSITEYFMDGLDPIVNVTESGAKEEFIKGGRVRMLPGKRHEFLDQCKTVLEQQDKQLPEFKRIIAVVRNPYDMELSRYFYLQHDHPWDKGPAKDMAMTADFETFAVNSPYHGRKNPMIHRFYTIDGEIPPNMRIIRYENLSQELDSVLKEADVNIRRKLPKINQSKNSKIDRNEYLTEKAKSAIHSRFSWIFDQGFYQP
jgi:hypothetical protein